MQQIQFPLLGNSLIMALVILVHVFIAFMVVGASAFAAIGFYLSEKKKDKDWYHFSINTTNFLSKVMKINGVLGVFIIILIIGLWGEFGRTLFGILFWAFFIEGVFFLGLMTASALHRHSQTIRCRQLLLSFFVPFFGILAAFMINGVWAFMMMPGKWLTSKQPWDAFFNPILWESFIHLFIPFFLNAALIGFIYSWYQEKKISTKSLLEDELTAKNYYAKINRFFARFAASAILLQPLSGLSFFYKVKNASQNLVEPTPYQQIIAGQATIFFYTMLILAAIGVLGALLYWVYGHARGRKFLALTTVSVLIAFFFGAYTREKARKPYLIHSYMFMNMQVTNQPPKKSANLAQNGKKIFDKHLCASCHQWQGQGGTVGPELKKLSSRYNSQSLKIFLKRPGMAMPPFSGSETELTILTDYLLEP